MQGFSALRYGHGCGRNRRADLDSLVLMVIPTAGSHVSLCHFDRRPKAPPCHFDRRPKAGVEKSAREPAVCSACVQEPSTQFQPFRLRNHLGSAGYVKCAAGCLDCAPLCPTGQGAGPHRLARGGQVLPPYSDRTPGHPNPWPGPPPRGRGAPGKGNAAGKGPPGGHQPWYADYSKIVDRIGKTFAWVPCLRWRKHVLPGGVPAWLRQRSQGTRLSSPTRLAWTAYWFPPGPPRSGGSVPPGPSAQPAV
jgi:hypothetical protein